jgi:DNA-binding IscR family transcriptional regulator
MQIGSRFSVAVHVLLCVEVFKDRKVTSDFIAASVNTNPVVIRRIMGQLRDAGLIAVAAGTGGISLTRAPAAVTLLDVYRAVDATKDGMLFRIHQDTAPGCPVGGNIDHLLEPFFLEAQSALEGNLGQVTLEKLLRRLDRLRAGKR